MLQRKQQSNRILAHQPLEFDPDDDMDNESDADAHDRADAGHEKPFISLLVVSALSVAFAHGANDVGNAVGPMAAIIQVYCDGRVAAYPRIPFWVLSLGAAGFVFGIMTLGANTIGTVGSKITKLTPSKSFSTQMGAAIAVLSSSVVGLPVSTSHCLVGAVIGTGLAQKVLGSGKNALNLAVLKKIIMGWLVTIPLAMLVAVIIFTPLQSQFLPPQYVTWDNATTAVCQDKWQLSE